ncbi:enoyl-CoA hydratase/isomerase family protein [Pelagibacterium lacus]|nr:enoyl-CoA hydratase-related protein [Pelagibacterium lacus]
MGVRFETSGGVARIVFDTPGRKNALSPEDRFAIGDQLRALRHDPETRVILMTGEGADFCSGADVTRMGKDGQTSARTRMQRGVHAIARELAAMEKPVISAVRGAAVGFGWTMPLASDFVIASDTAKFSMVFSKRGLVPDGGAIHFLIRHLGQMRAKELVYTARMIDAQEALDLGLLTSVVSDDTLDAAAEDLCASLLERPTLALGMARRLFEAAVSTSLDDFLELEAFTQSQLNQSEDYKEAVRAFLEKRKPQFHGR